MSAAAQAAGFKPELQVSQIAAQAYAAMRQIVDKSGDFEDARVGGGHCVFLSTNMGWVGFSVSSTVTRMGSETGCKSGDLEDARVGGDGSTPVGDSHAGC